ncbi:MAG: alpha/beta hydrolase [Methanothrix sp.]|nr:alpha/beta hydrolase [Methanothrix sp.]
MTLICVEATASSPTLCVDDGGSGGIPVLFVHSLAGNSGHWSSQLDHLRKNRRAIAIDLRGHGRSDPARDGDYSIEAMANDIDSVARALGLARFVLVGHSMGGSVSIEYAGRHPEKVAGLLLADPSGDGRKLPSGQVEPFLAALDSDSYDGTVEEYWKAMLVGSNPLIQENVLEDLRSIKKEVVIGGFRSMLSFDPIAALLRFPGKKLSVITHLNDMPISLHNLLPDLPDVNVSGTGHWLQLDRPDEFNRIMDGFLLSLADSAPSSIIS